MLNNSVYPKPDGAHTHAYMSGPKPDLIGFPNDSRNSFQYPFPMQFDPSDPMKLIEKCEERGNCPIMGKMNESSEFPPDYLTLAEHCDVTNRRGCPAFLSKFSENTGKDLGWREIFEFPDSSVIDTVLSNFHELKSGLNPPIKLGHDESQNLLQNSGFPAAGWITDLKRLDGTNKLLAYFSGVPQAIVKLIESGGYRKLSPEIYPNYIDKVSGRSYGPTLRAVSLLGADIPEQKNIADLTVIYNNDDQSFESLKTFVGEKQMKPMINPILKLQEDVAAVIAGVGEIQEDDDKITKKDKSDIIVKLKEVITKVSDSVKTLEPTIAVIPAEATGGHELIRLAEKVDAQDSMILKLSESLKLSEGHVLESKKEAFSNSISSEYSPAFKELALKYLTFAEDDKVLEFINGVVGLNDRDALFLSEEEQTVIPSNFTNRIFDNVIKQKSKSDEVDAAVMKLSETEKISFSEAWTKYQASLAI